MRKFQTILGGIVTLINVTDLDDNTVIGTDFNKKGLTRIFSKELEINDTAH